MNLAVWFTIVSVDSSTQLTLNTLFGGPEVFSVGDTYRGIDTTSTKFIINDTVVENSSSDGLGLMTRFGYKYFVGTGFRVFLLITQHYKMVVISIPVIIIEYSMTMSIDVSMSLMSE